MLRTARKPCLALLSLTGVLACGGTGDDSAASPPWSGATGTGKSTATELVASGANATAPSVNAASTDAKTAESPAPPANDVAASRRPNLQWKRYAAFENDLAQALSLPVEELCTELGKANCVRGVHLAPLGGHNPFETGLLESSPEPLATTSTVVDRIVLSACSARVERDAAGAQQATLFGALDLRGPAPAPTAAATREVLTQLYRRFLGRDAEAQELTTLAALAVDAQNHPVSARDFALTACFVVGTNTEALFF